MKERKWMIFNRNGELEYQMPTNHREVKTVAYETIRNKMWLMAEND